MIFTLRKASDLSGAKPVKVEVKTLDDLASLQGTLVADEIRDRGYNRRKDLIYNTPFTYELIIDFHDRTITFWNYWME